MSVANWRLCKDGWGYPELFGDINGLHPIRREHRYPLALASPARIRYPVTCLASAPPKLQGAGILPAGIRADLRVAGECLEMANVVVVGAQWCDEGKGKIVDWLSEQADIVVRFQGGHNAGHTLVINGKTYKLALLPSGVLRPSKLSVIGNGVVFDPQAFLAELDKLRSQDVSITRDNLRIAENVTLILPLHRELDSVRENASKANAIGTTQRGIGPAYEDKVGRRAIRLMDLADPDTLPHKIDRLLTHHNALRRGLNLPEIDGKDVLSELMAVAPQVLPFAD